MTVNAEQFLHGLTGDRATKGVCSTEEFPELRTTRTFYGKQKEKDTYLESERDRCHFKDT